MKTSTGETKTTGRRPRIHRAPGRAGDSGQIGCGANRELAKPNVIAALAVPRQPAAHLRSAGFGGQAARYGL